MKLVMSGFAITIRDDSEKSEQQIYALLKTGFKRENLHAKCLTKQQSLYLITLKDENYRLIRNRKLVKTDGNYMG